MKRTVTTTGNMPGRDSSTARAAATQTDASSPALSWALRWVSPEPISRALSGRMTIGRSQTCDIVLTDDQVSREHACIEWRGTSFEIRDLDSINGVFVDGERAKRATLVDGTVIRIGSSIAVISFGVEPTAPFGAVSSGQDKPLGSHKLREVFAHVRALAKRREPVYIHGETGTGKEAIARLLHHESGRTGQCITVNCAALRGDLAVSALFGHVRGAFSSAIRDAHGAALEAEGGTLFLDEIADLQPEAQPLLLRLLQNGELMQVGASRARPVDVRVVSATHHELRILSNQGLFREDLYYRLATHRVSLPALRQRREDIVELFVSLSGFARSCFSPGFLTRLLLHPWPGNVRELANLAMQVQALPRQSRPFTSQQIQPLLQPRSSPIPASATDPKLALEGCKPSTVSPEQWQQLHEKHAGIATKIAHELSCSQSAVKRYLAKHGLRARLESD